jgi:hypothetical protein
VTETLSRRRLELRIRLLRTTRLDALFADVSSSDLDALDEILHDIDPRNGITHGHDG